jgi:hypothetical protein
MQRKIRIAPRLFGKHFLKIDRRPDRLSGRVEDDECFVAANLDERPAAELRGLMDEVAELRGQAR